MKIFQDSSKMYIKALKSRGFREEFNYQEPKMANENDLYMNKEKTTCNNKEISRKKEKGKLYESTLQPFCKLLNIDIGKYFLKLIDKTL